MVRIAVLLSTVLAVALLAQTAGATGGRASKSCSGKVTVPSGTFSKFVVEKVTCSFAKTFAKKQITGGVIPYGWLCTATKTSAKSFNNSCADGSKSIKYHFVYT